MAITVTSPTLQRAVEVAVQYVLRHRREQVVVEEQIAAVQDDGSVVVADGSSVRTSGDVRGLVPGQQVAVLADASSTPAARTGTTKRRKIVKHVKVLQHQAQQGTAGSALAAMATRKKTTPRVFGPGVSVLQALYVGFDPQHYGGDSGFAYASPDGAFHPLPGLLDVFYRNGAQVSSLRLREAGGDTSQWGDPVGLWWGDDGKSLLVLWQRIDIQYAWNPVVEAPQYFHADVEQWAYGTWASYTLDLNPQKDQFKTPVRAQLVNFEGPIKQYGWPPDGQVWIRDPQTGQMVNHGTVWPGVVHIIPGSRPPVIPPGRITYVGPGGGTLADRRSRSRRRSSVAGANTGGPSAPVGVEPLDFVSTGDGGTHWPRMLVVTGSRESGNVTVTYVPPPAWSPVTEYPRPPSSPAGPWAVLPDDPHAPPVVGPWYWSRNARHMFWYIGARHMFGYIGGGGSAEALYLTDLVTNKTHLIGTVPPTTSVKLSAKFTLQPQPKDFMMQISPSGPEWDRIVKDPAWPKRDGSTEALYTKYLYMLDAWDGSGTMTLNFALTPTWWKAAQDVPQPLAPLPAGHWPMTDMVATAQRIYEPAPPRLESPPDAYTSYPEDGLISYYEGRGGGVRAFRIVNDPDLLDRYYVP